MRKVLVNGVSLHYQQYGAGSDVILVHGLTSNLSFWVLHTVPRLMEHHRITVYDLRGHGFSGRPSTGYTSAHLADELHGLMDALGIARAHVVGHSYGGTIALHHALRYPERVNSIVVADSAITALRTYQSFGEWPLLEDVKQALGEYGVTLPENDDLFNLRTLLPQLKKVPVDQRLMAGRPRRRARMGALVATTTVLEEFDEVGELTEDRICSITSPTLALFGEHSPFRGTALFLQERLPRCRAIMLPGGGHLIPAQAAGQFSQAVREHCATVEAEAAVAGW